MCKKQGVFKGQATSQSLDGYSSEWEVACPPLKFEIKSVLHPLNQRLSKFFLLTSKLI